MSLLVLWERFDLKLDIKAGDAVWIYGSGTFAETIISQLENVGIVILGVFDHLNLGKQINSSRNSYIVKSLSQAKIAPESRIILAVCNLYGDLKTISSFIDPNIRVTSPVELFQMFSQQGIESHNYWLTTDFELYSRSRLEIQSFREALGDDESKILFDDILDYREHGLILDMPSPRPLNEQYLAKEYLTPPKELRIIDLGACQGENLNDFLNAGHSFIDGFLFEPDMRNMKVLRNRLELLNLGTLECHPLGAWSETRTLKFSASGNAAAALSGVGDISINVVALDDFIPFDYSPNFVKMDIEGAEMQALEGMTSLIENHRPHLAISVYHKPSDLWTIGNFLRQRFPNFYNFYLRMYGEQTFDTILYAVPLPRK
jgi:FkbM family methyltransferase